MNWLRLKIFFCFISFASGLTGLNSSELFESVVDQQCNYLKMRGISKYQSCLSDTEIKFNSLNSNKFDSIEENERKKIINSCNYLIRRDIKKLIECLNNELQAFSDLPEDFQEKILLKPSKNNNSLPSESNLKNAQDVFERFNESVYMVIAGEQGSWGQGSAVAISRNLLLTNCHVVYAGKTKAKGIYLFHEKNSDNYFSAKIFASSVGQDKCILKSEKKLKPIPMRNDADEIKVGEQVLALGYPIAEDVEDLTGVVAPLSLSEGIVSAIREDLKLKTNMIQTTAYIINGSSGGALLDLNGNLVGITTQGIVGTSLNFAIRIDEFEKMIK